MMGSGLAAVPSVTTTGSIIIHVLGSPINPLLNTQSHSVHGSVGFRFAILIFDTNSFV